MTTASQIRPAADEYAPYYAKYIQLVQHADVLEAGHELHHMKIIREKYLQPAAASV